MAHGRSGDVRSRAARADTHARRRACLRQRGGGGAGGRGARRRRRARVRRSADLERRDEMIRASLARTAAGLLAAALAAASTMLPLWSMTMRAPQYPRGLHLYAYGSSLAGDVHEINILNHYIGMPPIET